MTNAIRRHKRWTGSRWVPNMRGSLSTWNWKQRNAKPQHLGQIAPKPAPRAKANRSLSSARKRDASPAASSGGTYCQNSPCRHGWISSLDDGDCEGGEITNSCGPFVRRQSSEPRSHSRKESPRAAPPHKLLLRICDTHAEAQTADRKANPSGHWRLRVL